MLVLSNYPESAVCLYWTAIALFSLFLFVVLLFSVIANICQEIQMLEIRGLPYSLEYFFTSILNCLQIETENGNKTLANLEKILDDYKAIRQENSVLAAKVREG